jgi:hypothetical protein
MEMAYSWWRNFVVWILMKIQNLGLGSIILNFAK